MTLPAVESWDVYGLAGPHYTVGPQCSNPHCRRWAEHAHHIVRRSQLAGDFSWIDVKGVTLPNIAGLCADCHDDITGRLGGHKAAIRLTVDFEFAAWDRRWLWALLGGDDPASPIYREVGPLDPHPPSHDVAERASAHPVSGMETCPTCGAVARRRRPASHLRGSGRRRKTWTVKVPDDSEDGADVLDTLIDDLALVLGYDPGPSARYYVLVPVLVSAQMNRSRFVEELRGVGG